MSEQRYRFLIAPNGDLHRVGAKHVHRFCGESGLWITTYYAPDQALAWRDAVETDLNSILLTQVGVDRLRIIDRESYGTALAQAAGIEPVHASSFSEIFEELAKATAKFPTWPTDPLHAVAVLGEEFGELTKEVVQLVYEPHKTTFEDLRTEARQTAAMALRFYLSLHRYEFTPGSQHAQAAPADGKAVADE